MERITKADFKELLAEFRAELKADFKEFRTCKPAVEAQTSGLQVAVDLLQQQDCRGKGNGLEEAPAADPLGPSATPAIVQRGPEVVLPASTEFIITVPTTCSMEGPSRDTTESRSAPAPTTAPTVHMAAADIDPVLAAPPASDGTINGQGISGVASTPATCSMICLPRQPVAAPVLVVSSSPTPTEYILDTNMIHVAAVSLNMTAEFPAVTAPTDSASAVQLQQCYKKSEFFISISSQCIKTKVHVRRPIPWPSFVCVHADGVEARPWPWPSFGEIKGCEFPSNSVKKAFQLCISDSSHAKEPRHYFCSCQRRRSPNLNSMRWSVTSHDQFSCVITGTEWVLQPWDSGQQADFPYDQFTCADHCTSGCPDYFVTGSQDFAACSTMHLFLSGFSISFGSVVIFYLQIARGGSPCVYLQKLQMDKSAIQDASYWPGYFLICSQMLVSDACSTWQLFLSALSASLKFLGHAQEPSGILLVIYLVHILFFLAALTIWPCIPVLSLSNILGEWHLVNQSIIARVCPDYPLKYNWLADTWRSWLLCVRSVCATVYKLWHIPWLSSLFLELTSEEPYRLALFQWEMTWQPNGECFDVSTQVQFSILDMKYLIGTSDIFLFVELWVTQFISQYFQWRVAWALPICVPSKLPRRGIDGTTPRIIFAIMHRFQLQYASMYSSSFVSANEELFWEEKKLELHNWVSYMLEQYNGISTYGMTTELHSLYVSTSRPLMQATGVPHGKKKMELTLLAAQGADTDGIVTRKQYIILMQRSNVPWDPGGSTCCLWFSTCDEHKTFQGGRNATAVTTFFEQVFAGDKHCLDFNQIRANLGASFSWVPASHGYYIICANQILFYHDYYLNQAFDKVYNDIISYRKDYNDESSMIKESHMPWDPGKSNFKHTTTKFRLGVKPNFKEGGVLATSPTMPGTLGHHMGLAHQQTTNTQAGVTISASKLDQAKRHGGILLPSGSHPRSPFLLLPFSTIVLLYPEIATRVNQIQYSV